MAAGLWRSSRLLYRGVNIEDEDFLNEVSVDADGYIQASPFLPVPRNKKTTVAYREFLMDKSLLGAVICLPPPETPPADGSSSDNPSKESTTNATDTKAAKPIPIGIIALAATDSRELDHHRHSTIGINVIPEYQGKGYGTEAIKWVLRWGFKRANLHYIGIGAFEWNTGAWRLYEKIGFKRESLKREYYWHDGAYVGLVELGMLDREWKELYGDVEEKELTGHVD